MTRSSFCSFLLSLSCLASGAEPAADAGAESADFTFVVDASLVGEQNAEQRSAVLQAWMLYAAARVEAYDNLAARGRKNPAIEDYEIELAARNALAMHWGSLRASEPALANPYLDKLVAIGDAGFMEEYVLYFFVQPGWTVSAASLALIDFAAFAQWGNANLGGIEHPTLVSVESKLADRPQVSAQPGAALPDPAQYAASANSCAMSTEALNAAGQQWAEESKLLDGAPLAAADRNEFIFAVTRQRNVEPFRTQGMAWVSDRPARLTFLAGFCAVEADNLLDAEWWLRIATALKPLDGDIRGELVYVLTAELRFDEADELINGIMATSLDPCELAAAWRRRGYIRFEQGELEEARTAYLTSLEYEPDSNLALSELQLIDQTLFANDAVAAPVPPVSGRVITTCQSP